MCGFTGFLSATGFAPSNAFEIVTRMSGSLAHRGPDDGNVWLDADAGIALGHRRLAVIDLSPAGKQPMQSASGRYLIVYNGEIYNHLEMRAELEALGAAPPWRGHSDTETLLASVEQWGVAPALERASGMFAFALWDRDARTLTLARDRMGEKPLYYGWQGDAFLFGSELKALRGHPSFRGEVDRDALAQLMRLGYVVAPASIYRGIFKLPAGSLITLSSRSAAAYPPQPRAYWTLRRVAESGLSQAFDGSDDEAADRLEAELRRAVVRQTIADVPLGAFLSGGIDSTTVVALLQSESTRRVKTFTVGFNEAEFQEAQHAAAVARHLGTEHSELYVTATEAMQVIADLPVMYDEPLGDSSAIPTHLIAKFARQQVTVCLSGDGGDELFGGYRRYHSTADIWRRMRRIPSFAKHVLSAGCQAYARSRRSLNGWKAGRMALYLDARDANECYAVKITQWTDTQRLVLGSKVDTGYAKDHGFLATQLAHADLYARMMYSDAMTYLPDDILAKVDRAAMAVSLETRIPMLDPRVVEFAWSLPLHLKVRDGRSKWLLRRILAKYVPDALMDRPKMGFGIPVGEWIRGPMRPWAEELLAESRLRSEGFLNAELIREHWSRHLDGTQDASDSLWPVLMFQAWLARAPGAAAAAAA